MNILFSNTTKYTKNIYNDFLKFHRKKFRLTYIVFTVFVISVLLLACILHFQKNSIILSILALVILIAFFLWRYFYPIYIVSKEYKSDAIKKEKEFTFKFYKKKFSVEDDKQYSFKNYFDLYRIYETKTFFYLYIDRTHAFVLDKLSFRNDKVQEFSDFIKKKCILKYRKINKGN